MNIASPTFESTPPFNGDLLQEPLRAAAAWNVVHRPATLSTFPARVGAARRRLRGLEHHLVRVGVKPAADLPNRSTFIELRAGFRQLRSSVHAMSARPRVVASLPRVVLRAHEDEPRVASIAATYFNAVDGKFSAETLRTFVDALQAYEPLDAEELWYLSAFLKFALVESILDEARTLIHSGNPLMAAAILVRIKSLRSVCNTDWRPFIEPLIVFDGLLREDPAGAYAAMDFDSRELYRRRVAFISRRSDCTESQVARTALDLARESEREVIGDRRVKRRRMHVGYYIVGDGFCQLAARVEFNPRFIDRVRMFLRDRADENYLTAVECVSILFIALALFPLLPGHAVFSAMAAAFFLVLLPVSQCAVDLVNNVVMAMFDPEPLAKLDFSKGVPIECTTLVAVPTLLLNEDQVRRLITDLEIRFLANRDPHVHFALLTDLADSVVKPHAKDSHPLVELAVRLIDELNVKYSAPRDGAFILLHRHRIFNVRQGVWMGWERKRGKLLDLNKLLVGEFDAFPIKAGRLDVLGQTRYVLTLDSDTQLPRECAAKLIGAIAHPLNQAVVDPRWRVVVAGYGILQPRVGVSVRSASRSRMAAIYSGQNGFDVYARAISDAYQDLFGEGTFTGKGIYEVATFHSVLNGRFPRNSLLSHDLIEGAYTRAGLATDIEVIDDYPSHWSAYSRRKHRWVRGDWQIAQWLFSRVPDESGSWVQSPISAISRWKIFDNLRRSLVEPFTFILFVAGWLGLPGGALYWTLVSLILLFFPTLVQFVFGIGRAAVFGYRGRMGEVLSGFRKASLVALLNLVFLPHQTMLSIDAIVRALVRRFITGERLLEWETSAQAELHSAGRSPVDRYLMMTPLFALGTAVLIYLVHRTAIPVAAPVLFLWAVTGSITRWLNAQPREERKRLSASDKAFLLGHALRIWRYFAQFGGERHNFLVPDNIEEGGVYEAARVSPTNAGLLLNARQAACQLGFLSIPEFVNLTQRTFDSIATLKKFRGHLYNWYDTHTLEPIGDSPFISSVDSGNLVASLYTLRGGSLGLLRQPLLPRQLCTALRAHWCLMKSKKKLPAAIGHFNLPRPNASVVEWIDWLPSARSALAAGAAALSERADRWWVEETQRRVDAILALVSDCMPWLLPAYAPLRALPEIAARLCGRWPSPSVEDAAAFARTLESNLARAEESLSNNPPVLALVQRLRAALPFAERNLRALAGALKSIAQQAESMAEGTEFAFLVNPGRQILSIGYDVRERKIHEACYDMIASEARIATFLAIARGDLAQQSWLRLDRSPTRAYGRFIVLSWTGTMFEYLMPALWMRSYPDSLISRSLAACVNAQRAFARSLGIPWGISESGAARRDDAGHYAYHAFGVPKIAIWVEATAGPVVSPYSTFLALGVDSVKAIENLRHMHSHGWFGDFGFYEAADFVETRNKPHLVREWMAHHQGMSLLAIVNLLHDNAVQRWFHSNPPVQATERLLHEMPPSNAILRTMIRELAPIGGD